MDKETALSKIQKLLRMGTDSRTNANEVAIALERAALIAKQHEIDLEELMAGGAIDDSFITKEVVIGPYLDPMCSSRAN